VRQLPDETGRRIEHVDSAAERADPDLAVARFMDRRDARSTQCARIADLDGEGFETMARIELVEARSHRADPQRAAAVREQRHHPSVIECDASAEQGAEALLAPGARVVLSETASHRGDP